jgi:hypothetical protein
MNGQQRAVLWIGLILLGLNLALRWSEIKAVIFNGAGMTVGIPGSTSSGSGSGGIQIPIDPLLPGTTPKITIPLSKPDKTQKPGTTLV